MKNRVLVIMLILISALTLGFTNVSSNTNKKIVSKTGVVIVNKSVVSLKMSNATVVLTGNTKELMKNNKKEVKVNGYMEKNKFFVKSFTLVKRTIQNSATSTPVPTKKPTVTPVPTKKPAVIINNPSSLTGILTENSIEGLHYELNTKTGIYILTGYDKTKLKEYIGKVVKVSGSVQDNKISIYQRGNLFTVKSIELVSEANAEPYLELKNPNKTVELIGVISVDKVKGTNIALTVDGVVYGLNGNIDGLETFDGLKVKVEGTIPDVRYIRAPDFILFEVAKWYAIE